MFEKRKIDLLTNKVYLLGEEYLNLIKEGKYDKAENVNKEIRELTKKIQELNEKQLDKTMNESDDLIERIDKKIEEFDLFQSVSDKEAENKLDEIMGRK